MDGVDPGRNLTLYYLFYRRRRRKIDNVRERIPRDTCVNSHKRASQLFTDFVGSSSTQENAKVQRLRYSTYGPLLMPLMDKETADLVWPTTSSAEDKKTSDAIEDLHTDTSSQAKEDHPVPRPRKLSTKKDEKYLDTKSLDSIGLTDVESIMTLDELHAPTKTSSQVDSKDSGTECTTLASPLCRTKQSSQKSLFESNRFSTAAPMTPQHVACSLRLMSIWHAYFVLDIRFDNQIDVKELRTLGRYVSKFSSEKVIGFINVNTRL